MAEKQQEKPKNETTYVVLLVSGDDQSKLIIVGDVEANGPEQAVRRKAAEGVGVYVAVPARNWTIVGQQSETPPPIITQTVRKWGEGLPEVDPAEAAKVVEIKPESRDATRSATPRDVVEAIAAPHPAEEIEEDGA